MNIGRRGPPESISGARGRVIAWLALLGTVLALGGCTRGQLPCPAAKILREASTVTKFTPGQAAGPSAADYVGSITDVKLSCSYDATTYEKLSVTLGVQIAAERNPAAHNQDADLRYFVAIVNLQGEVLAKKEFALSLPFPPGSNLAAKVERIEQLIPLKYPQNGGSLQIWVGFQLSDAELQYNRAHAGS